MLDRDLSEPMSGLGCAPPMILAELPVSLVTIIMVRPEEAYREARDRIGMYIRSRTRQLPLVLICAASSVLSIGCCARTVPGSHARVNIDS
ncbi:hypothetical protein F5X97DRAFT_95554 [Nemania serpens]|nr:hypothetical protein F5X97DRAFT_95554 [Nemania serpens]